ncbi:DUF3974 domain-containing protein [Ectobacillus antri]|uniref:DUF3974 domain-containing protein n=1 Tax=Ectobacillus antri TaxID=2486280 RepID=UPI000F5ACDD9|nr:DUF3974 domain-containing protein [Ectobacillus antri]
MDTIISIILTILGIGAVLLLGTGAVVVIAGRRLYVSWKQPYKRAVDSMEKLSHKSIPFLQDFTHHASFRRWLREEGRSDIEALSVLFCATDHSTKGFILDALPRHEQKRLHIKIKQKKNFAKEDIDFTAVKIREYMEQAYQQADQTLDMSFYTLYFHEEYGETLKYIQNASRTVHAELRETIQVVVTAVLRNIPYYRTRRLYEQQHKYESFIMKDLPEMLEIITQLPPSQRPPKEEELTSYLQKFYDEFLTEESMMYKNLDSALQVKMQATKEKFFKN